MFTTVKTLNSYIPISGIKNDIAIAKAIGIILMVIGHAGCPNFTRQFIYMFHMPLFFFLAGYCFKEKYLSNSKDFILRKFKGLWMPFVLISLLFLFLHNLFFNLGLIEEGLYSIQEIFDRSKSIIISLHKEEPIIGGFWFIPQLFWGSLISFMFLKFCNRYYSLVLSITFAILFYYMKIYIPYTAISWMSFYASSFFIIGNIFANINLNRIYNWGYALISLIIVLTASILIPDDIFVSQGWKILPYLFVAICGCIFTLNVSRLITLKNNTFVKTLVFIGSKTMWVLTLHLLAFKLLTLLIIYIKGDSIANLRVTPIYNEYSNNGGWIIYSILGVLIPIGGALIVTYINDMRQSQKERNDKKPIANCNV